MTVPEIFSELDKIVARFNSDIRDFKAKISEPKPIRLIQQDLFDSNKQTVLGIRPRLGDNGFADAYNPLRQEIGRKNGSKPGLKHAVSPDRRKPGTVNVAAMTVNQHREYWRWAAARKKARKANAQVPSWDTWKACVGAK